MMLLAQSILPFLPGYFFDGRKICSTGAALPPTQHIHPDTGEVIYYVRPIFDYGSTVGLFVRHQGILDWLKTEGRG